MVTTVSHIAIRDLHSKVERFQAQRKCVRAICNVIRNDEDYLDIAVNMLVSMLYSESLTLLAEVVTVLLQFMIQRGPDFIAAIRTSINRQGLVRFLDVLPRLPEFGKSSGLRLLVIIVENVESVVSGADVMHTLYDLCDSCPPKCHQVVDALVSCFVSVSKLYRSTGEDVDEDDQWKALCARITTLIVKSCHVIPRENVSEREYFLTRVAEIASSSDEVFLLLSTHWRSFSILIPPAASPDPVLAFRTSLLLAAIQRVDGEESCDIGNEIGLTRPIHFSCILSILQTGFEFTPPVNFDLIISRVCHNNWPVEAVVALANLALTTNLEAMPVWGDAVVNAITQHVFRGGDIRVSDAMIRIAAMLFPFSSNEEFFNVCCELCRLSLRMGEVSLSACTMYRSMCDKVVVQQSIRSQKFLEYMKCMLVHNSLCRAALNSDFHPPLRPERRILCNPVVAHGAPSKAPDICIPPVMADEDALDKFFSAKDDNTLTHRPRSTVPQQVHRSHIVPPLPAVLSRVSQFDIVLLQNDINVANLVIQHVRLSQPVTTPQPRQNMSGSMAVKVRRGFRISEIRRALEEQRLITR